MWGIWYIEVDDWLREQHVSNGGTAILAYESKREACRRAARHWGFGSYREAKRAGWCEVRLLKMENRE